MKRKMTNTIQQRVPLAILPMWATIGTYPGMAQQAPQPKFPSAAEATQTLFQAVQGNNAKTIANILGGPTEFAASGDPAQDKLDREMFVQKYQEMHRLGRETDGSMTLYIGAENWPFPIPLVEKSGAWRFDSDAGQREILFRTIGENELTAIDICHQLVAAEKQFQSNPNATTQVDSRLASLVSAAASGSASSQPVLIQGYYFRVAAQQPKAGSHRQTAARHEPSPLSKVSRALKRRMIGQKPNSATKISISAAENWSAKSDNGLARPRRALA